MALPIGHEISAALLLATLDNWRRWGLDGREMANDILISSIDPHSEVAAMLINELVAELTSRYADRDDNEATSFSPEDATVPRSAFILANLDGEPVGCGAIRPMSDDVAEIKLMYVRKERPA